MQRAMQRWSLGVVAIGLLAAILADLKAQTAPGPESQVLAADGLLGEAVRNGDKATARRLLSLQFSFIDENGKLHARRDFLTNLKGAAFAPASGAKANIYGLVATVTGQRKSALGDDVFFLHVWAKQKRAWRALVMQDVVLAAADSPAAAPPAAETETKPYPCKNPCETIPYRVRSAAEQDIINAFQAVAKASAARDADAWSKHVAEEFMLYRSGRAPIPKSGRVAAIAAEKESNAAVTVGEVQALRLSVYDNGAAMVTTRVTPDNSRSPYHAACIWVKRNGQWLMAISAQTDIR